MRVRAKRPTARATRFVGFLPASDLLVTLSTVPLQGAYLNGYDADLNPVWETEVRRDALGIATDADTIWVLDQAGISLYEQRGGLAARIDLTGPKNLHAGGFIRVDSDFIVAWEHVETEQLRAPVIMRVTGTGEVRWSTELPLPSYASPTSRDKVTWRCSYFTAGHLVLSGNRVLVLYRDMPGSGAGVAYVMSLDTGAYAFSSRLGPIHSLASINDGDFLVGFQGYGQFETLHYGMDGDVLNRWPTHGSYVDSPGELRVVATRNDARQIRICRLVADGTIVQGGTVDGYYTSEPLLLPDARIVFFAAGALWVAQGLDVAERLNVFAPDSKWTGTSVLVRGESLFLACGRHWRVAGAPDASRVGFEHWLVTFDI